ncbi:hypothetical protein [Mycolicibacterium vulneris]|jgi:hypothetical protein|uniref:hypothetical protein n=1 Tax=Mycolicibacterium vulneris TaxID=547163 RepID=UPI001056A4BA|nr:hypothetical protein [Mycolicibacterium vulneris]
MTEDVDGVAIRATTTDWQGAWSEGFSANFFTGRTSAVRHDFPRALRLLANRIRSVLFARNAILVVLILRFVDRIAFRTLLNVFVSRIQAGSH